MWGKVFFCCFRSTSTNSGYEYIGYMQKHCQDQHAVFRKIFKRGREGRLNFDGVMKFYDFTAAKRAHLHIKGNLTFTRK